MRLDVPPEKNLQLSHETIAGALPDRSQRLPFMPKAGAPSSRLQAAPRLPLAHLQPTVAITATTPLSIWLNWLDQRLRLALQSMREAVGSEAMQDAYRGLYITPDDIDRLLAQPHGVSLFAGLSAADLPQVPLPGAFGRLAKATALNDFEIVVLLIAAAPELDLRYERLYAFLQDDVSRKRPTVDFTLKLLCSSSEEKNRRRACFLWSAPLLRYGLLQLQLDQVSAGHAPPLAVQALKVDEQVLTALLDDNGIDASLGSCAQIQAPDESGACQPPAAPAFDALVKLARQAVAGAASLRCYLHGPDALALKAAADQVACGLQQSVLHLDLALLKDLARNMAPRERSFSGTLQAAWRHAWMHDAMLCLDGIDALCDAESAAHLRALYQVLEYPGAVCLLTGSQARNFASDVGGDVGRNLLTLALSPLSLQQRQQAWHMQLAQHGLPVAAAAMLAARFYLSGAQTRDAVHAAVNQIRLTPDAALDPSRLDSLLLAAARQQTRHVIANLAQLIEPRRSWDDLILPDDALAQLREIHARFLHRDQVLGEWGFGNKLGAGTGTVVLFAGPSGTGKTMAAEVLAQTLGLDLYRIDLASVVSKYIGETEKNLDRLFNAADQANGVLFFDEADALFGKRTEVKDAHDRYANLETSYLLQKLEQYQGIAILASNLRQNLDEAFVRRLAFIVHFPFPDASLRRRIWAAVWPTDIQLAQDVDQDQLARELKLSGGNIKNVALAAAFLAAASGNIIERAHILGAVEREFQKLGRPHPNLNLNPNSNLATKPLANVVHS
jgi:AAA+ superfamily predicted ATPase